MECAAPSSFLITLPLRHFRVTGFGSAGIDRCAISWFASKPGRNLKTQTVAVGLQMWELLQRFSAWRLVPGAPVQYIKLRLFVAKAAADKLLLCTRPPRPCAPSCWLERLPLLECACGMSVDPATCSGQAPAWSCFAARYALPAQRAFAGICFHVC